MKLIYVLRRIKEDHDVIDEIVREGAAIYEPCDFKDLEFYFRLICNDSTRTYLLHYFNNERENGYDELFDFVLNIIKKKSRKYILEYYNEMRRYCP